MQEFIIIDRLPYLLFDGKAYAVRWDDKGFTLGNVFREGITLTDFPVLSELSVKAKCQGHLDSIGVPTEPEEPTEPEAEEAPKSKRRRKAKEDAE